MAKSPSHELGQQIGDFLELTFKPTFEKLAEDFELYLDFEKNSRKARKGKTRLIWEDDLGNKHRLDFVLEKDGSDETFGKPFVFIECAWRRYTKHSKNKAQEIQAAVTPVAKNHWEIAPIKAVVLGGEFTKSSLEQLISNNFTVLYLETEDIFKAFSNVGIDIYFNEHTTEEELQQKSDLFKNLTEDQRVKVSKELYKLNKVKIDSFIKALRDSIARIIANVIIIPLYGKKYDGFNIGDAISFLENYEFSEEDLSFEEFRIIIEFSNKDSVEGKFSSTSNAIDFLGFYNR